MNPTSCWQQLSDRNKGAIQMQSAYKKTWQRAAQTMLACLMFGQPIQAARAASTDISDVPMAVKNAAGANIMFTQDDSGSMQFEVVPENTKVYFVFPRPHHLYGIDWQYGLLTYSQVAGFETALWYPSNRYARYYRTAQYNRLYYDPAKRYVPWTKADKTLMSNSPPAAAWNNPYDTGEGTRNLTADSFLEFGNWVDTLGLPAYIPITYYPATYYRWNPTTYTLTGPEDANNVASNFTKVEIKSANAPFSKGADRTDCAGTSCTYTEEIQNFANWYSYYRSRILLSRAGVGQAFAEVGSDPRIGYAAINHGSATIDNVSSPGTIVSGVRKFDAAGRSSFYAALYGQPMTCTGTPLRQAVDDVGVYFSRTDDRGPWGTYPGTGGGTQAYCRQNYNILMTDGYWTEGSDYDARTSAARANVDGNNGPGITNDNTNPSPATYQYTPANPYSDSSSNTLADVAMYYWYRDLRTNLVNKVPTDSVDPAFWQHLVNLTVGLGVSGTISNAAIQSAFTSTPQTITWPSPIGSNPAKVDDLAHAAINSHGDYLNAADPADFAGSLSSTINNIIGRNAGAAAVAVANANVTGGDNQSYASKYNSGSWTGDLFAYPINLTTGVPDEANPTWSTSAQTQLDLRTAANRKIVTYSGATGTGQGRQFQPATASTATKLSTAQQTLLNSTTTPPGTTDGANVVAFLRGDRSLEGTSYRTRSHLLGDIINAEPLLVREPSAHYGDTCYTTAVTGTCTASFKSAQASRTRIVYQGANDGMLHAFNAASGAEEWAYIPNLLISSLNNLSRKAGFTHKYYVDGTPASGDVDFSNTDGVTGNPDPSWKTILVGGLNKGGRGYYAIDVTCPATQSDCSSAATEADIAGKVLWEFPNSVTTVTNNIGYSFGKPVIVKTASKGWVVLVTSGYNNGADTTGTGQGYLFVLNARTGDLIQAIATGVGSSTDPSGLAQIAAYVENSDGDNTTGYVYGGDLKGNVWRFDLTASNPGNWTVKRLAILKDAGGTLQPVTTVPELAKITILGADRRFVYVGTGQYLGDTDVASTGTQTMYALVDNLSNPSGITPVISEPTRSNLQQQTLTASGTTRTASVNTVDFVTKKGWYVDMPASGERINTDPAIALGALVFTSNIPSSDVCIPGGSSWLNILDYKTGGTLPGSTVAWSSTYLGEVLASRVVLIKLPSGEVKGLVRKSDATTTTVGLPLPSSSTTGRRVSWKELLN
jgi:type IV pilus assembly protein PilY1